MKRAVPTAVAVAVMMASSALAAPSAQPPPPPVKPVTETLFGRPVTDNYRYMESMGPETAAWMKAQGAYTRAMLDSIRPLPALQKRVSAFTGSFGFIQGYSEYGGRSFYEERTPGSDNFDLMARDAKGIRKLVDVAAIRAAHGGAPFAINWFLASPDGSKVAVGVSQGGSEEALMTVYDAATGAAIAGPVDRARFGATSWSDDSRVVYFTREKKLAPGEPQTDKYKDATAEVWDLKSEPRRLAGAGASPAAAIERGEFPAIVLSPGSGVARLNGINGVQNERRIWTAPAASAGSPDAPWRLLADRSDDVNGSDVRGDDIYLLSHKNAPTFQVLRVKAGQPLASAVVVVPSQPDRVIENLGPAADGLYVLALRGAYSELLRVPAGSDRVETIPLPTRGHVGEIFTDPRRPGVDLNLSSWVLPPTQYHYDPAAGRFAEVKIGTRGDIDPAAFTVQDLQARAADGVMVPLSLVWPKGAAGAQVAVVEAYGSYGISNLADFSTRRAAMMKEGIAYGVCHVRGGGELGEAWRLAGKDANKPNTWRDLIACGDDLVKRGVTTPGKLFILGGSAGGITVGRAMEERPELFAGVLDMVPAANTLRSEFSPNGPPNVPEFGSVTSEAGFQNLYAMDSVAHVKKGARYPAVLIATGLNDPRVSPWEPAKFAAALEASGSPNPVLLRIDEQAGHGVGSTRTQTDLLNADSIAFVLWRAGRPGWKPVTPP